MDQEARKRKDPFRIGIVLDRNGDAKSAFTPAASRDFADLKEIFPSLFDTRERAKLFDFCASAPYPGYDSVAIAANTAVFRLLSDDFPFGVAVKDRRFSGSHIVFYLLSETDYPGRARPVLEERFPSDLIPFGERRGEEKASLPVLARQIGDRFGVADPERFFLLTEAVIRRIAAFPELCCGDVAVTRRDLPDDWFSAFIPTSAYADLLCLLVSALNSSGGRRGVGVEVSVRGGFAEVLLLTRSGGKRNAFSECTDLFNLSSSVPGCFEKLALASYISFAADIPVDIVDDGERGVYGFRLTVFPAETPPEFKDRVPLFDTDALFLELSDFLESLSVQPRDKQ